MSLRSICGIKATASGNSGLLAEISARTVRTDAWPDDSGVEPRYLFRALATADAAPFEGVFARATRFQQVGLRGYVGGVHQIIDNVADYNVIIGGARFDNDISGWSVTETVNDTIQTASCSVPLDHLGRSPFGASSLQRGGPSPGLLPVHFLLAYKLPETATNRFFGHPLMMYGLGDQSPRSGAQGVTENLSFLSNMARYVKTPMTLRLPAGHGFTYGETIEYICQVFPNGRNESRSKPQEVYPGTYVGIPRNFNSFPVDDAKLRKAVTLDRHSGGDWLSLVKAIAQVYGSRVYEGPRGLLEHAEIRPELGAPDFVDGVISEGDIVRSVNGQRIASSSIGTPSQGPTRVELTGSHQITREDGTQRKILHLSTETRAVVARKKMPFAQLSDGSVLPISSEDPAEMEQIVASSETVIEKFGNTVISSITQSKALLNPTTARYTLNTDLSIQGYREVPIEENVAEAQAHLNIYENLLPSSESSFSKVFDGNGRLVSVTRSSSAYKHLRAFLQARSSRTIAWSDLSPTGALGVGGRAALGGGEAVSEVTSQLRVTELVAESYAVDAQGFVTSKQTATSGYQLRPGWQYRYGDNTESRDAEEIFGLISRQEESWQTIDDFTTSYQSRTYDGGGVLIAGENDVIEGQPPVAEKLDDATPKRSDYNSDADFAVAVAASQFEQQAMHAEVESTSVLPNRVYNLLQYSDQWSNYPWQMTNIGNRLILMAAAVPVTWTMLPNPLVRLGRWWHVQDRQAGINIDHDVQIISKTTSQAGPGAPILMVVNGLTWD